MLPWLREMIVYSLHGWRHFLVCTYVLYFVCFGEEKIKLHALLGHPASENFVSWCQTLKNSSASFLCIGLQETYPSSPRAGNLKVIQKCLHLKCIYVRCLDNWSRILSGKPFNTFSIARLRTLQFRLTLFTATHAFLISLSPFFFMICDWGSPSFLCRGVRRQRNLGLWLGYFFYSRDPRFMSLIDSPWFVKFSKMAKIKFRES